MTNRLNQLASLLQSADGSSDALLAPSVENPNAAGEQIGHESPTESTISDEESQHLRQEKLDTIKAAIARGDYDSDDLLDKAMNRMLERLGLDEIE